MADAGERTLGSLASRICELDSIIESTNGRTKEDDIQIDTEAFVTKMRNPNTVRKTTGDMKKFSQWLNSIGEY